MTNKEVVEVVYKTLGNKLIRRIIFAEPNAILSSTKFSWIKPEENYQDEIICELKWPISIKSILQQVAPKMLHPAEYVKCRNALKLWKSDALKKSWEQVLPEKILKWAWNQFDIEFSESDYDCVDNYRCAKISSPSQMRRFKKQRQKGCCGSHEWIVIGPDKEKYLFGFNYGH